MAKNQQNTAHRPASGITAQPAPTRTDKEQDDIEPHKKPVKADKVADFYDAIFWTVVAMVAVGTNTVAIILSVGLVILVLETAGKA